MLMDIRDASRPFYGAGARTFHPVTVRPSLSFALVPRPREREDRDPDRPRVATGPKPARSQIGALCRGIAAAAAAGGGAGLVDGSYSDARTQKETRRKGLHGLTRGGARFVEDFCALVREDRGCYGIWTVTLPPEAAAALDTIPDGAQKFGDVLRRRFGEALSRAAATEARRARVPVPDHWAFVVEPQKAGRPHWHFVFRCKARRRSRWLLGKGRLDRLIANSIRTVAGQAVAVRAAGNVQALRKDPGSYLSKYLRKGRGGNGADAVLAGGWSVNMVPFHWWGASASARSFVRSYCWELPGLAVAWLSRQWPALARVGAIDAKLWQPEADGAPAIVCGRWRDPLQLLAMLDHLFALAERRHDGVADYISRNDCADPCQHP